VTFCKESERLLLHKTPIGYMHQRRGEGARFIRGMLGHVGPQPGVKSNGEGEGEPKTQIYEAKWMRKPGDRTMRNMMGKRPASGETSTRREPVMSGPNLTANPAEESQSQPGRVGESADIIVRTRKPPKQESSAKAPVIFVIPSWSKFP
jgi:hypothetical protein